MVRSPKVRLAIFRHYQAAGWNLPAVHAGFIRFQGRAATVAQ